MKILPSRSGVAAALAVSTLFSLTPVFTGPVSASPAARPASIAPTPRWMWPTGGAAAVVGVYVAPTHRYGAGHRGVDIAAGVGSDVVSPSDGTVHFAGTVVDRSIVTIRSKDGTLASMEPVAAVVTEGADVAAGQVIGTVASGGHCSERCVHLGARVDGDYVSPLRFLGGIPRAVLLPMK